MLVDTPRGPARVHLEHPPSEPRGLLVLGHGAGGGVDAPDLQAVRTAVLDIGLAVARVEQPYRVAGKRAPAPATHLDEAWQGVIAEVRGRDPWKELPLFTGGRSSGARVACRTATSVGASGVVALAFPLHPPGRPERSRAGELVATGVPAVVVNGDRDPFGVPEPEADDITVHVLTGENHALDRDPAGAARLVSTWLARRLPG